MSEAAEQNVDRDGIESLVGILSSMWGSAPSSDYDNVVEVLRIWLESRRNNTDRRFERIDAYISSWDEHGHESSDIIESIREEVVAWRTSWAIRKEGSR